MKKVVVVVVVEEKQGKEAEQQHCWARDTIHTKRMILAKGGIYGWDRKCLTICQYLVRFRFWANGLLCFNDNNNNK